MTKKPYNITRFAGINNTDDPFLIGQTKPELSVDGLNFRAERGIKVARGGYGYLGGKTDLKRSGVYLPYGSKAILPLTKVKANAADTYLLCGEYNFTIEFWYKTAYSTATRNICRAMDYSIDGNNVHMCAQIYPTDTSHKTGVRMRFITGSAGSYTQADYYYEGIQTDDEWHHIAIKRDYSSGVDIQLDGASSVAMTATTASSGALVDADSIWNETTVYNDNPLYGNYLHIGGSNISLAEFRIWKGYRDDTEISDNMNIQAEVS